MRMSGAYRVYMRDIGRSLVRCESDVKKKEGADMLIYILKLLAGPILICAAGTGGLL